MLGLSYETAMPVITHKPLNVHHHLQDGLNGRWISYPWLDGGIKAWDFLGQNHASLTGGYTWASSPPRPGGLGPHLLFDGLSGALTLPNLIQGSGGWSIAAWTVIIITSFVPIIDNRYSTPSNGDGILFYWDGNTSKYILFMYDGVTVNQAISATTYTDSNWHHVVGT